MQLDVRCGACGSALDARLKEYSPATDGPYLDVDPCERCFGEVENSKPAPVGRTEPLVDRGSGPIITREEINQAPTQAQAQAPTNDTFTKSDNLNTAPVADMDDAQLRIQMRKIEEAGSHLGWNFTEFEKGFMDTVLRKYPDGNLSEKQHTCAINIVDKYLKQMPA